MLLWLWHLKKAFHTRTTILQSIACNSFNIKRTIRLSAVVFDWWKWTELKIYTHPVLSLRVILYYTKSKLLFWRPRAALDRSMPQHLQHKKGFWWQYEVNTVRACETALLASPIFTVLPGLNTLCTPTPAIYSHLLTLQRGISHSQCAIFFFKKKKKRFLTVSNIISWHLLNVIIYLLCCKQGQMLGQMHWHRRHTKTVKVTLQFRKRRLV